MSNSINILQGYSADYGKSEVKKSGDQKSLSPMIRQGLKNLGVNKLSKDAFALLEQQNEGNKGLDQVWTDIKNLLTAGTLKLDNGKLITATSSKFESATQLTPDDNLLKEAAFSQDINSDAQSALKNYEGNVLTQLNWVDANDDGVIDKEELSENIGDNKINYFYKENLENPENLTTALAEGKVSFVDGDNDGVIEAGELRVDVEKPDGSKANMTLECYNAVFDTDRDGELTTEELSSGWENVKRGSEKYGFSESQYFNSTKFKTVNPDKIKSTVKSKVGGKTVSQFIQDKFSGVYDSIKVDLENVTYENSPSALIKLQTKLSALDSVEKPAYKELLKWLKEVIDDNDNSIKFNQKLILPRGKSDAEVIPDLSANIEEIADPVGGVVNEGFDATKVAGDILKSTDIVAAYDETISTPENQGHGDEIKNELIKLLKVQLESAENLDAVDKLIPIALKVTGNLKGSDLEVTIQNKLFGENGLIKLSSGQLSVAQLEGSKVMVESSEPLDGSIHAKVTFTQGTVFEGDVKEAPAIEESEDIIAPKDMAALTADFNAATTKADRQNILVDMWKSKGGTKIEVSSVNGKPAFTLEIVGKNVVKTQGNVVTNYSIDGSTDPKWADGNPGRSTSAVFQYVVGAGVDGAIGNGTRAKAKAAGFASDPSGNGLEPVVIQRSVVVNTPVEGNEEVIVNNGGEIIEDENEEIITGENIVANNELPIIALDTIKTSPSILTGANARDFISGGSQGPIQWNSGNDGQYSFSN